MNTSEKNIKEASNKILSEKIRPIYLKFMALRFPEPTYHTVLSYALEWTERFNTGSPENYMDRWSKKCYEKARETEE